MYELDDLKRLAELQAMEQPYVCGICDKDIVIEYIDDIHADDSGEYHYQCWREEVDNDMQRAMIGYTPRLKPSDLDAYEPGSAKRYSLEMEMAC